MDTNVAGLNKVFCFTSDNNDIGKTVTITDGINVWKELISEELSCMFLIPSMPAPAKRTYTVTLHFGDETTSAKYTRDIELGFGDSIQIGLRWLDEPVTRGTIPTASANTKGGFKENYSSNNGIYMSGEYLQLATASSTQKGGVKTGNNMSVNTDGLINPANIEYGTSSKTSGSSSLTTGRIYCQYE